MKTLFFLILISLLTFSIINSIYLRKIFLLNKRKKSSINDEKYFEIKYTIQMYVIVFSIIVAATGFFGFDKYNEINNQIDTLIKNKISKYDSTLNAINTSLKETQDFINNFNIETEAIKKTLLKTGSDAKNIQKNINILASRKVSMPNIYVVKDIKLFANVSEQRINYKDLKTFDGKKLPIFSKAPLLNIPSNFSVGTRIKTNTEDYFIIELTDYVLEEKLNYCTADIWILSED